MTQMPGVKKPVNSWMYWNAWSKLPSSGFAVTHRDDQRHRGREAPDQDQVPLRGLRDAAADTHPS